MRNSELETWRAERAIQRVIQGYARGVDQQDFARVRACFHLDAKIQYGEWFRGDLDAAMAWLEESIPRLQGTLHVFSPPWIDLDLRRSEAECETYAINSARYPADPSGDVIQNVSGTRYLDHFERRAGTWAIVERSTIRVWSRNQAFSTDPPLPHAKGLSSNNSV